MDSQGRGYLHYLISDSCRSGKIVELLLDHGVKLDSTSAFHKNSLLLAASKNQSEIIPLLLQHGISVNSFDEKSNTALHIACAHR
jgi:ankyrin repeat protein